MAEQREGGFELVLSNRQLLSLFFVVVVFFAAFFSVGYVVGFGHGEGSRPAPQLAEAPAPAPASEEVRLPDSLLTPTEDAARESEPEPPPAAASATPKESPRVVEPPAAAKPTPTPPPAQKKAAAATPPAATTAPRTTTPPAPRPAGQTAAAPAGSYNVQVSAVRVAADANNVANNLRQKGYPAHVEPDKGDGWHRVFVGPFASREAAVVSRDRLTTDGFKPILRGP